MNGFFSHTEAWIRGEMLEGIMVCAFGLLTILAGLLFWRLGTMPSAKALLWPLVICGVIYASIGLSLRLSNGKRLAESEQVYLQDKEAFVHAEQKRVEAFQYQYVISKIVASVCFVLTMLIFWLSINPRWQGIGIGLSYFGLAGLVVELLLAEQGTDIL
ncbi:MAG: hypothetical protein SPI30_07300 [Prevotella sp.]|nr:hypothetical protein [Prevotella sp.]